MPAPPFTFLTAWLFLEAGGPLCPFAPLPPCPPAPLPPCPLASATEATPIPFSGTATCTCRRVGRVLNSPGVTVPVGSTRSALSSHIAAAAYWPHLNMSAPSSWQTAGSSGHRS